MSYLKKSKKNLFSWLGERLVLSKRQQFVVVTLVLTGSMMATQLVSGGLRIDLLFFLMLFAYVLSALVLREELAGWEYLTLLTLPAFYTAAVFLFYYLLPTRWLTRLPIATLYAIGMYAILLTENIYNVAAERSIQLLRAAQSVGFLLTLVTFFFLIETILSLHLVFYLNILLTIFILIPLTIQVLWPMELSQKISRKVILGAAVITSINSMGVAIFSFWPIRTTIQALFLTTVFYSLVGMTQQYLIERLFAKTMREYLVVLVLVSILVLVTTRWGVGIE